MTTMKEIIRLIVSSIPEYRAGLEKSYREYEREITCKNGDFYASAHKFYRCLPSPEKDRVLFAAGSVAAPQKIPFSKAKAGLCNMMDKSKDQYSALKEKPEQKFFLGLWEQLYRASIRPNDEAFLKTVENAVSTGKLDYEKQAGSLAFTAYLRNSGYVESLPTTPDDLVQILDTFEKKSSDEWQDQCEKIRGYIQDYDGIWEAFGLTMVKDHGVSPESLQLHVCNAGILSVTQVGEHPRWWLSLVNPVLQIRETLDSANSCEIYAASLNTIADSLAAKHSEKIEAFAEALETVPPEKRLATIFLTSFKIGTEFGVSVF